MYGEFHRPLGALGATVVPSVSGSGKGQALATGVAVTGADIRVFLAAGFVAARCQP